MFSAVRPRKDLDVWPEVTRHDVPLAVMLRLAQDEGVDDRGTTLRVKATKVSRSSRMAQRKSIKATEVG